MTIFLRLTALVVLLLSAVGAADAQVSLATAGVPVTQNFDALPASGSATWSNNTTIAGGYHARTGTGTTIVANNGGSTAGNLYSYGSDADRALGSLGSGNAAIGNLYWGVRYQNNTGATITSLQVSYAGEQWRNSAAAAQTIGFSYLVGNPAVDGSLAEFQSAGIAVAALDFTSPVTGGTAGALDGNLAANRSVRTATITGLNIPVGGEIMLRWADPDHTGADHGLAIDDLTVTVPGVAGPSADLSVSISDSPDPVAQGGALLYTVVASNAGPDAATGVSLSIPVPAGTAWSSFSWGAGWDCLGGGVPAPQGPGTFTCTASSVAAGASTTFRLNATVGAASTGPINATTTLSSSTGDPNPGNNSATATTAVLLPITAIHDIQGPGATSPRVGNAVRTRGIVTGRKGNGFFLQAADAEADADPMTSEGVFVFTNSAPPATAAVGNLVTVDGTVSEFIPATDPGQSPLTEIVNVSAVASLSVGNPLPTPVQLSTTFPDPAGPLDQLERLEGMRVTAPAYTVVAPTQGNTNEANATGTSNGILSAVVAGVARPFREPGIQAPDTAPGGGSIPPIPRWDDNPEILTIDSRGLGAPALDLAAGAGLTGVVGPLNYGFRRYTVMVEPTASVNVTAAPPAQAARAPLADEFTVAGYNLERFFDTVADPAVDDVVLTPAAFANRLNKASLGIRDYLHAPDILAVVEMENLATLQALATRINGDAVAAGQPDPAYVAYLDEGNDVGGIDVGFLVKTAEVAAGIARVEVLGVTQFGKATTWTEPAGTTALLNDRPPLALDAIVHYRDGRAFPITVIGVHQRSLNGADGDDANGDRVRRKRQAQAEFLANLIQGMQLADPDRHIIALGDYNAFEFNDGLTDAMGTVAGQPSADSATAVPGDGIDLVNPDLVNLDLYEQAGEHYSFSFDGNAQSLDHALANEALLAAVDGFGFDHARINADFPEVARNDANSPSRLSDHDPDVAYFLVAPLQSDLVVSAQATPTAVPFGTPAGFTATVRNDGPDAAAYPGVGFAFGAALPDLAIVAPGGWSCDAPQVVGETTSVACNAIALALDGVASFAMTATAPTAHAGGNVDLVVVATAATHDPDAGNNTASTSVQVQRGADLAVAWQGAAALPRNTARATYRATLRDLGIDPASAAFVRVSTNLLYQTVQLAAPAGWRCQRRAGRTFVADCLASTPLAVGANAPFDLTVSGPAQVQRLQLDATVGASNIDPELSNNQAAVSVPVQ